VSCSTVFSAKYVAAAIWRFVRPPAIRSGIRTSRFATVDFTDGIRSRRVGAGRRLARDRTVVAGLEQRPHTGPNDLVVVEETHTRRVVRHPRIRERFERWS
jgi:hypothetical protein